MAMTNTGESIIGASWEYPQIRSKERSIVEHMLALRDIQDAHSFFYGTNMPLGESPWLFSSMRRVVDRIKKAIDSRERIAICGDYDIDGVTGSAILVRALLCLKAEVTYRIPDRERDGYGINMRQIRELADAGVTLMITVDNGITKVTEVGEAAKLHIDTIITDHHGFGATLPAAYAILHPLLPEESYPQKHLSGSGVALKLALALAEEFGLFQSHPHEIQLWTVLGGTGLIGDMVPIIGENRDIVREALKLLKEHDLPGFSDMILAAGIDKGSIDSRTIGFQIGPRINAAGRLERAETALELFLSKAPKRTELAYKLNEINKERQTVSKEWTERTIEKLKSVRDRFLTFGTADIPQGIVGLISGKVTERFGKPSLIYREKAGMLHGSLRSPKGLHITELLARHSELIVGFGGHAQAAGLTMSKQHLPELTRRIEEELSSRPERVPQVLQIESTLSQGEINIKTAHMIRLFEPYGMSNPEPIFSLENIQAYDIQLVGNEQQHLRMTVPTSAYPVAFIGFGMGEHAARIKKSGSISLAFQIGTQFWNGKERLNLKLCDIMIHH